MSKRYEWSLIPYPYLRTFNLFTAFLLTSIAVGFITSASIETRAYFMRRQEEKLQILERENNIVATKPISDEGIDAFNLKSVLSRAIRVGFVSSCISFFTYLMMYFIFGFGGGMVSMRRKWRLFSSIPA